MIGGRRSRRDAVSTLVLCIESMETGGGGLICGGLLVLRGYRERGGMMEGGWVLYLLSYGDGTTTYRRRRGWIEGEIGVRE